MRAFLSHSSLDKDVVITVHNALERDSTWLDRAEIEWGELFLEKIADGIKSATDFVLFWTESASKSEWVRLEVNMAFIQRRLEYSLSLTCNIGWMRVGSQPGLLLSCLKRSMVFQSLLNVRFSSLLQDVHAAECLHRLKRNDEALSCDASPRVQPSRKLMPPLPLIPRSNWGAAILKPIPLDSQLPSD